MKILFSFADKVYNLMLKTNNLSLSSSNWQFKHHTIRLLHQCTVQKTPQNCKIINSGIPLTQTSTAQLRYNRYNKLTLHICRGWPKLCACFTLNYRWVRMTAIQWPRPPQPLCGIDLSTTLKFIPKMRIWGLANLCTFFLYGRGNYVLLCFEVDLVLWW